MFPLKFFKMKHTISLRATLILAFLLIGSIPVFIQSPVMLGSYKQNLIDSRMQDIQNQCWILSNKMTRSGYLTSEPKDPLLDNEMSVKADMFNGRIVIVNRSFRIIRDTFSLSLGKINVSEEVIRCFGGENSNKYNSEKRYSALTIPIYSNSQDKEIDGVMIVTASTEDLLNRVSQVSEKGSLLNVMIISILAIIAVILAKLVMKPFRDLQRLLNRASEGNMDEPISSHAYKETMEITDSINQTLKKLKAVDQSREEFVSNVSHELKTPITSIRVLADSLIGMDDVPVELYREFMGDMSEEIERENKIINDLLSLVKMDKTSHDMNIETLDINQIVERILKRLRPIAQKQNIELVFETFRTVEAEVDETKLSLAVSNLVENAIKYNHKNGWVHVSLNADHKFFYLKVADSGMGIPKESQEHIFERFYRVDKSHSREIGGTGLGLAITRSAVVMHRGAIKVYSEEGEGTTFTVRIPLKYVASTN